MTISYAIVNAAALAGAHGPPPAASPYDKGVGAALGVRSFGIYQVELPAHGATVEHDHGDDGAEDVYCVLRGSAVVAVDGECVPVAAGDFVAVSPPSRRQVVAGADGVAFIAVCAPLRAAGER